MKAYKIFIPELSERVDADFVEKYCGWDSHEIGEESVLGYQLVREKIHELVQKHAFELGYPYHEEMISALSEFVYINLNVTHTLSIELQKDIYTQYIEISWQDFLKLTPADVKESHNEFMKNLDSSIHGMIVKSDLAKNNTIQKNDRNEKAWDILKVIASMDHRVRFSVFDDVILAFEYADEFIRQSNAGENNTDQ